jgi:NADPH:quinone reductase-like Zn-dependent oxidoreductase
VVSVRRSTVIEAPIEAVWEILRDFNGHDRWHPAVRRSALDGGKRTDQVSAIRSFDLTEGEHLREQLLSMSDADHSFRYAIVESEIPLQNYIAEVCLKPVTDSNRTFWSWTSRFDTPRGREQELAKLVGDGVYEAGFEAVRARLERHRSISPTSKRISTSSTVVANNAGLPGMAMGINRFGGPEELHPLDVIVPPPGPGEVRLRQTAIGVNYIDIYCRSGYFDLLKPPGVPGMEAVGVVESVGAGVRHLSSGQRVGYACPPVGAYVSVRTLPAALVIPLPDQIEDVSAAAGLLKGMTAEFLLHRVHQVKKGDIVLVYAPAGGVGRILCQWASHLGATVIGATSSEEKARFARAAGAQHVILPGSVSLEDQVRQLTRGHGADVIYDAVGKDSFDHSVAALATCGHLVSFGQASGDIGPRDISSLASSSATISRPNFGHYTDTPEKVAAITERLFSAMERRIISIDVSRQYPLLQAADAHRALEARETTGSTVLIPDDNQKGIE